MVTKAINAWGQLFYMPDIAGLRISAPATGPITQAFGVLSVTGILHRGTQDVSIPHGTPVRAVKAGRVIFARTGSWSWYGPFPPGYVGVDTSYGGYGNQIYLDHGSGITSRYAHLTTLAVALGDTVAEGEIVGWSGSTGISTGDHLHWEVRQYEVPFDGAGYIGAPPDEEEEWYMTLPSYTRTFLEGLDGDEVKNLAALVALPAETLATLVRLAGGIVPVAIAATRAGFVSGNDGPSPSDAVSIGIRKTARAFGDWQIAKPDGAGVRARLSRDLARPSAAEEAANGAQPGDVPPGAPEVK